ncbi:hypothetical protein FO519_006676 [Halicephalobus sp. NKZ332]|nr:hypothetical protein FO519_006676 [Halicephalobus sp. NKZ332]
MNGNYAPEIIVIDDNSSTSSSESSLVSHGLTPDEYCEFSSNNLTDYEKQEIFLYPEVYFTGAINKKLRSRAPEDFDDNNGAYKFIQNDHIAYRYELLKKLGSGSFGQVYECYDHREKKSVAVKIVRTPARVARSAVIEIDLLSKLSGRHTGADYIIRLIQSFEFRKHQCLVFELMGPSLYDHLKGTNFRGIIPSVVKSIADSILLALDYLKRNNVIHCDLKPENILFYPNDMKKLKLIDFGSACRRDQLAFTYIQSRFYRAPEVLMGIRYDVHIDMWSFGCIIPELLTGSPLFAGDDSFDQMTVIMEVLGEPSEEFKRTGTKADKYFRPGTGRPLYCQRYRNEDGTCYYVPQTTNRGKTRKLPAERTWRTFDQSLINFLRSILKYNGLDRVSPTEAYNDPWLREPIEVITIDD